MNRWEDEEKAVYGVAELEADFRKRLFGDPTPANDQANRRLLDMLAGWGCMLFKCSVSQSHPDVTPEEYSDEERYVASLYQEAGQKELTKEERREFLLSRILPFLEGE